MSSPPFAHAYTKVTRAPARLIVDAARFMALADVAGWLDPSWDTVKTVVQRRREIDYRKMGYRTGLTSGKIPLVAANGGRCMSTRHGCRDMRMSLVPGD